MKLLERPIDFPNATLIILSGEVFLVAWGREAYFRVEHFPAKLLVH